MEGTYSLKFYDVFGENYQTGPIILEDYTHNVNDRPGQISCPDVVSALESLPNTVVPSGSVVCQEASFGIGYASECGVTYSLTFTQNPGYLKDLEINYHLDGSRPTIYNSKVNENQTRQSNASSIVYSKGPHSGAVDYWGTRCEGFTVRTKFAGTGFYGPEKKGFKPDAQDPQHPRLNVWGSLQHYSQEEYDLLATCLGDADGITSNNIDVYDWDPGSVYSHGNETMGGNPHVVRLVPKGVKDKYSPAFYHLLWASQLDEIIYLASPPGMTDSTEYIVYATDGVAEVVFSDTNMNGELDRVSYPAKNSEKPVTVLFEIGTNTIYTSQDVACETASSFIHPCLEKGDIIFLFDANWGRSWNRKWGFGAGGYETEVTDQNTAWTRNPQNPYQNQNYASNTGVFYTIKKIYRAKESTNATNQNTAPTLENNVYMKSSRTEFSDGEGEFRIVVDSGINWDASQTADPDGLGLNRTGYVQMIKFSPATTGNFPYVGQCSYRGQCDGEEGLCDCDIGYTGGACDVKDVLAI